MMFPKQNMNDTSSFHNKSSFGREELIKSEDYIHIDFTGSIIERLGNSLKYQKMTLSVLSLPALGLFSLLTTILYLEPPPLHIYKAFIITSNAVFHCIFYVGAVMGAMVLAPLADRYGRKKLLSTICIISAFLWGYTFFARDDFDYSFILAFSGICVGGYYVVTMAYLTEIIPADLIGFYCLIFHLCFPVSSAISMAIQFYVKQWVTLIRLGCFMPVCFLFVSKYLMESPTFLISRGEHAEAAQNANKIATFNAGKEKKVELENCESPAYLKEFADFEKRRAKAIFQYSYFCRFESSRTYLTLYSALSFCNCFTFTGLVKLATVLEASYYIPYFICLAIGITIYFQRQCKVRRIISSLLFIIFIVGTGCAIILLYLPVIHDFATLFLYPLAFITSAHSFIFAANNCPCRVRATGFGLVAGVGIIATILGKLLGEYNDHMILVFSLSGLIGTTVLKWIKKAEYPNEGYNDIYEICEHKRKFCGNLPIRFNMSFYSMGRESTVKQISMLDANIELEKHGGEMSMNSMGSPLGQPSMYDRFVTIPVEGVRIVQGLEEAMGITSIRVFTNGLIVTEGIDSKGVYTLEGKMGNYESFKFVEKHDDSSEIYYNGQRYGCTIYGQWTDRKEAGDFKLVLKMGKWEGNLKIGDADKNVQWLISVQEDKVTGILEGNENLDLMQGVVKEDGRLEVVIIDLEGNEIDFEGYMEENTMYGTHKGNIVMTFTLEQVA